MSDRDLQTLRRAVAATGAPSDRAALLRARVRAGELALERVELAAYCGDELAQEFIDPGVRFATPDGRSLTGALDFRAWLDHLARRWADAGLRAAAAAARVAYGEWAPDMCDGECGTEDERDCPITGRALRAIEAAEAWLAGDPTEERWTAFHVAYVEAGHLAWLPPPCSTAHVARILDAISAAADLAGEAPVRRAICDSLVSWALGDA